MFAGKPTSGPPKAGINLIKNQKHSSRIAKPAQHRQEICRWNADAPSSLNRLHKNCAAVLRRFSELLFVCGKRDECGELIQLPPKRTSEMFPMRCRKRAVAKTVITPFKRNHP